MAIWFTADHHFGHKKILEYADRPFDSVGEMDEYLISRWNENVKKDDIVFHLGDFTLANYYEFCNYVRRLNGVINIIPGGHDYWLESYNIQEPDFPVFSASGVEVEILPPLYSLELPRKGNHPLAIVLCHYSMRVWDRSHYGSLHLFGHSHGNLSPWEPPNLLEGKGIKSMDVGVDVVDDYSPISLKDVVDILDADYEVRD